MKLRRMRYCAEQQICPDPNHHVCWETACAQHPKCTPEPPLQCIVPPRLPQCRPPRRNKACQFPGTQNDCPQPCVPMVCPAPIIVPYKLAPEGLDLNMPPA